MWNNCRPEKSETDTTNGFVEYICIARTAIPVP